MNFKDSGNQIFVDDIYAGDNNEFECLASINNYSSLCKRIAIGQNIASNEFGMIFPNSIGESKWKLLFYPKGQYVEGKVGGSIGIYLVMLSCEQADKTLKANVSFQLQSQNEGTDGPVKTVNAEFDNSVPSERWIGEPHFVGKNWLNARRQQFWTNDSLVIRCLIEETLLANASKENGFTSADNSRKIDEGCSSRDVDEGCSSRDASKNSKDSDWCEVGPKKGKKKQPKNPGNADTVTQKNGRQRKRKNKPNKGGKRKK